VVPDPSWGGSESLLDSSIEGLSLRATGLLPYCLGVRVEAWLERSVLALVLPRTVSVLPDDIIR